MNSNDRITRFFLLFCAFLMLLTSVGAQELGPDDIDLATEDTRCVEANYRHKTARELERMTAEQLIDESEKEWNYHVGRMDKYDMFTLNSYQEKIGVAVIPILTKLAGEFASRPRSMCQQQRFFTAFALASDVDNQIVRLRGRKDGRAAMAAAEAAIQSMENAGLADQETHPYNKHPFGLYILEKLHGINEHDNLMRKLLEAEFGLRLSDEEMFEFVEFLTTTDPTYPSWTPRVNNARNLRPNKKKYRDAYLRFKKPARNSDSSS